MNGREWRSQQRAVPAEENAGSCQARATSTGRRLSTRLCESGLNMAPKPQHHRRNIGPMLASPRCGARTRSGQPCRAPAVNGKKRCRMHGGAPGSGAPHGNQNALKHGRYTRKAIARDREARRQLREARRQLRDAERLIRELSRGRLPDDRLIFKR
jgi:hypothetical protein